MTVSSSPFKRNGIYYFLHGFRLLLTPGIKRFVIIPLLLNLLVLVGLFWVASHYMAEANHWLLAFLPRWLHWLNALLWALFGIGFILFLTYTYVTLANLVAAPFNGLLSEKITLHLTTQAYQNVPPSPFALKPMVLSPKPLYLVPGLLATVKDTPRLLARQCAIIAYYLPRALGISVLYFIPLLQIVATPLWFLFNAGFMTLQYVDYPSDNQRVPLHQVREKLRSKRALSLSFGICVLLASMVPLLNLLAIPAAVAGATELWWQEYKLSSDLRQ